MTRYPVVLLGCIAAVAVGLLGAGFVYGDGGPRQPASATTQGATSRAPAAGERSIEARTMTKRGEMGVLVYRNEQGDRCIAAGVPKGDTVGVGAGKQFQELPLADVGACSLRLDPVAVKIMHARDYTVVYGLAGSDVSSVTLDAENGTLRTAPAADGAFIAAIDKGLTGSVSLTAHLTSGQVRKVSLGQLPDFDKLTEDARRNAPPTGAEIGHDHE
jgi:hypothetical protein